MSVVVEIVRRNILVFLCWCKPKACHGDILKKAIEEGTRTAMEVLEISDFPFSETLLKENYKRLMFKNHPDRNKGEEKSVKKTQKLNEAYGVLKNLAYAPPTEEKCNVVKEQYGKDKQDKFIFWEKCVRCSGTGKIVYSILNEKMKMEYRVEVCPKCYGLGEVKLEVFNPVIPKGAILFPNKSKDRN